MKILIKVASFGFTKGEKYPATLQAGGFFASNGSVSKFISNEDAEVSE